MSWMHGYMNLGMHTWMSEGVALLGAKKIDVLDTMLLDLMKRGWLSSTTDARLVLCPASCCGMTKGSRVC